MTTIRRPTDDDLIVDPAVPALEVLLGPGAAGLLERAAESRGVRIGRSFARRQVRFVPGRSVVVEFTAEVIGDRGASREIVTLASGIDVPDREGFVVDGTESHAWWFPDDPFLPGLRLATDPEVRAQLLEQVGLPGAESQVRTRAYRATRRAVVELHAGRHRVFLKVLRPERAEALHERHRALRAFELAPPSHGLARAEGIVVIGEVPGQTLRVAVRDGGWSDLEALDELIGRIAALSESGLRAVETAERRLRRISELLRILAPEATPVVDQLLTDGHLAVPDDTRPVHGDLHTGQLLVDPASGAITGMIDLDTLGLGDDLTDRASMLGQLVVLADLDARYAPFRDQLVRRWGHEADPQRLAARTAVQVLALATGPFRAQESAWSTNTARRVALAEAIVANGLSA